MVAIWLNVVVVVVVVFVAVVAHLIGWFSNSNWVPQQQQR